MYVIAVILMYQCKSLVGRSEVSLNDIIWLANPKNPVWCKQIARIFDGARVVALRSCLISSHLSLIKQIDKTQPYNRAKQVNVFKEHSVDIVSIISLDS